ncbi:MAG: GNAT family N-acetyltransferase [Pleurocapsa sp. SU_196_0]|nr:GNAT family N-acetyltransferase [Pleurocapsa sp. SU_196_0]
MTVNDTLPPRRATSSDAESIRVLVREAYSKWVGVIGREPKPMEADYGVAVRDHLVWVLEDAGVLVAVLELIPHEDHVLIENIAVVPMRQKRGFASRLMRLAETQAREFGMIELRLYTNEHFVDNLEFYARLGYAETHRQPFRGSDTVYMTKRIDFPA